ncbi:Cif family virulence factor [Flavisolibacter nicotianae]|uniref:hypothetical protein n=1 Tax=Flavisolibacter nicotianae TaxID=2364882 RepID=UPI000EADA82B|nr:hypothetical protein [Flavisolibacter nicotianae]
MKRVTHVAIFAVFALLASTSNAQNANVKQTKTSSTDEPYKIDARNLSIGNMAYAQKVLRAWKDFDDNTLDNSISLFADDIVATFPDGTLVKGRDNFIKMAKDSRNNMASVVSTVAACTTLKSPDHPESETVTIWGMETDTHKDGTVTKMHLNEVWFFNKEGKVYEFHQMAARDEPEKK